MWVKETAVGLAMTEGQEGQKENRLIRSRDKATAFTAPRKSAVALNAASESKGWAAGDFKSRCLVTLSGERKLKFTQHSTFSRNVWRYINWFQCNRVCTFLIQKPPVP